MGKVSRPRLFHTVRPVQLIYNSGKTSESKTDLKTPGELAKVGLAQLVPDKVLLDKLNVKDKFQHHVEQAQNKVLTNRWYLASPRLLKPYIAGFLTRPIGFGLSFFIIHEITAIVPLISLWYFFIKFDWIPVDLPTEFIAKGVSILTEKLTNVPDSKLIYDKASIIIAGANAYAATKLLMPFRLPLSILLTPWFDRAVVQRVKSLFSRK